MLPGVNLLEILVHENIPGVLGVLEFSQLGFVPQRLYWISNIPVGASRGNHAHKKLKQVFILLQGAATIKLRRGVVSQQISMTRKGQMLTIPSGLWREIMETSIDTMILVVCDQPYSESDYIRDFDEYIEWCEHGNR